MFLRAINNIQLSLIFCLLLTFSLQADPRLEGVKSFALALGVRLTAENINRLAEYDLLVLDGENATADNLTTLRSIHPDIVILGYLSVGTIENFRSWYRLLKPFRLELWGDWGEWYADVRNRKFRRRLIKQILPTILVKDFDGLFLDNLDMISTHPRQKAAMFKLVSAISAEVKEQDGLLFAQNGFDIINPFLPFLDGWNLEDVLTTYNFDKKKYRVRKNFKRQLAQLASIQNRGLFVTATDYARSPESLISLRQEQLCPLGIVSFLSNINLSRLPTNVFVCE
jgi:endo-alpha-1,4-polygalactosaminidase (GH114 family)